MSRKGWNIKKKKKINLLREIIRDKIEPLQANPILGLHVKTPGQIRKLKRGGREGKGESFTSTGDEWCFRLVAMLPEKKKEKKNL